MKEENDNRVAWWRGILNLCIVLIGAVVTLLNLPWVRIKEKAENFLSTSK